MRIMNDKDLNAPVRLKRGIARVPRKKQTAGADPALALEIGDVLNKALKPWLRDELQPHSPVSMPKVHLGVGDGCFQEDHVVRDNYPLPLLKGTCATAQDFTPLALHRASLAEIRLMVNKHVDTA